MWTWFPDLYIHIPWSNRRHLCKSKLYFARSAFLDLLWIVFAVNRFIVSLQIQCVQRVFRSFIWKRFLSPTAKILFYAPFLQKKKKRKKEKKWEGEGNILMSALFFPLYSPKCLVKCFRYLLWAFTQVNLKFSTVWRLAQKTPFISHWFFVCLFVCY